MRKSSSRPAKYTSPLKAERPIQLFAVLPMSDGRSVIAVFVPATAPSMYSVPVYGEPAASTTAMWCQPEASTADEEICCSFALVVVVIAKRTGLGAAPWTLAVRNMYPVVLPLLK